MEKARIGVISPYPEFTESAVQVARELGLDIVVREETADKNTTIINEWEKDGLVEIVIARGNTAEALKKQNGIPVLAIEITSFDIAEAIHRARNTGSAITLVEAGHRPLRYDFEKISGIVGVGFSVEFYRSEKDLHRLLQCLSRQEGAAVVCTDVNTARKSSKLGLKTVLVHSSREFIQEAIKRAHDICRVRKRDLRLCRSFQAILENAYDGILAVEREKVTLFNPVVEKTTGLKAEDVLGRHINDVCAASPTCRDLYGGGKVAGGEIVHTGKLPLVVTRAPVMLGQNNCGIMVTFQAADKISRMEAKIRQELHSQGLVAKFRFSDIVGRSIMITEAIREARKYARSEAAVLITGESGTGKELFAQSIHNESHRREGPFVAVNCAALPENLLESELFGYEEGAFTGARKGGKQGLFTLAHGGTIFLDEVGELSTGLQARLLRVLQEKEVMPVGGQRVMPVDVRVISATNRNLPEAVSLGRFRKDLYFRLNVLNLQIPPLRFRLEDVPELFKYFMERLAGPGSMEKFNIDNSLLEGLKKYLWPGNIRELEGYAERYVALGEENVLTHPTFYSLMNKLTGEAGPGEGRDNPGNLAIELGSMTDMERQILLKASQMVRGNKAELAKMLGISRTTLWKKLKSLGPGAVAED